MTEYDIDRWAQLERARNENIRLDIAIASILAALNTDGLGGWNDWSSYASLGEW